MDGKFRDFGLMETMWGDERRVEDFNDFISVEFLIDWKAVKFSRRDLSACQEML